MKLLLAYFNMMHCCIYCVLIKKASLLCLAITMRHERKVAIKRCFIFPPHLTSASALPGKQETQKLHLFTSCCFANKDAKHIKTSPSHCWTTLSCQNNRLHAPDRTYEGRIASCTVTLMLDIYQVSHGVDRIVKNGSCSSSSLEWKSMNSISWISYYLNKC